MTYRTPARRALAIAFALSSAAVVGCDAPMDTEAPAAPAAEVADSQAQHVTISGALVDAVSGRALDAAQVCIYDDYATACAQSDAAGRFSLPHVPADSRVALEFTRESFQSLLVPITTSAWDESWELSMMSELATAFQARRAGITLDDEQGQALVRVSQAPQAGGVAFSGQASSDVRIVRSSSAPDACDGRCPFVPQPSLELDARVAERISGFAVPTVPTRQMNPLHDLMQAIPNPGMAGVEVRSIVWLSEATAYAAADGMIDKALTATSAAGEASIFNMRPGVRAATLNAPKSDLSCAPTLGWTSEHSDQLVVFPIEPGFTTVVAVDCAR